MRGYTNEQFQRLYREYKVREDGILANKQGSRNVDVNQDCLTNFRWSSLVEGRTPAEICFSLFLKHVQTIMKTVKSGVVDFDWVRPDGSEGVKMNIADARNYLMLLAAIFEDAYLTEQEAKSQPEACSKSAGEPLHRDILKHMDPSTDRAWVAHNCFNNPILVEENVGRGNIMACRTCGRQWREVAEG